MKRLVGLGWWHTSSLLLGTVAAGTISLLACSSDTNGGGSAGANVGGSAGTSANGGSASNAGAGGSAAPGGSPSAGGGAGATGSSAGTSGGTTEKEIAVSLYACKPDCPDHQYCALLGPECATEPCLVHAVCRDLPACSANQACPVEPQDTCLDDPSDSCNPATGMACPGRCYCTEGPHPCGDQDLDRRPNICECVTPGPVTVCLDVKCPGDDVCDIVLGKAYCVSP